MGLVCWLRVVLLTLKGILLLGIVTDVLVTFIREWVARVHTHTCRPSASETNTFKCMPFSLHHILSSSSSIFHLSGFFRFLSWDIRKKLWTSGNCIKVAQQQARWTELELDDGIIVNKVRLYRSSWSYTCICVFEYASESQLILTSTFYFWKRSYFCSGRYKIVLKWKK